MDRILRVGIIGANADRGWARESHVPAVQHLAGLQLAAVANKGQETADAAAKAFGAAKAYGDVADLFRDPDIDLVTVAVTLRGHRELILAALASGKHVYCEYPLGLSVEQSRKLAGTAHASRLHTAIGLQTRSSPVVLHARAIIDSGAIGRVLTLRGYSPTVGFGATTAPAEAYTEQPENGVTLVTIQGAHTIDLVESLLGSFQDLAALASTQYPAIRIGDGPVQARATSDHLLVQARMSSGAVASIEVAGGRPQQTPFSFEIVGESGVLSLSGGAARGFQSGRLTLAVNGMIQTVDEGEVATLPDAAANVGATYAALRDDIFYGTFTAPSFEHAVHAAILTAAVERSSSTGKRQATRE